jgi:Nucleotidyl transferase AbiEii toxin, Type IV TA system
MNQTYIDTVRLLLAIAPAVFSSGCFAMKGGTALNLFVQDMPRLSVDIDVVYTDHAEDRDTALARIAVELGLIQQTLEQRGLRVRQPAHAGGDEVRLVIANAAAQVKVEVNFVFRGTVLPVHTKALVTSAENLFTTALSLPVLATDELYGSKLVAAMDRQHSRDIFDVMLMGRQHDWQDTLTDCFVAYLAGHNRPVHEVLFPKIKPLEPSFTNEFVGMTREDVSLVNLKQVQVDLITQLPQRLLPRHKQFLLSLVQGEPAWDLMPYAHLRDLPALKWKQLNLSKLKKTNPVRFAAQHDELKQKML